MKDKDQLFERNGTHKAKEKKKKNKVEHFFEAKEKGKKKNGAGKK